MDHNTHRILWIHRLISDILHDCIYIWRPAAMLSNLDENPPVNSNIEPSINATFDLSNDSGSRKTWYISDSYSRVRYKIVIEKQKRHELWIVNYELLHDKLAVVYSCRGILNITARFQEHIISKMTIDHCVYICFNTYICHFVWTGISK